MPFDPQTLSHFKGIAVALFGVIAAALGIYFVGVFKDYFETNPICQSIMLTESLSIDILGALVPLVAATVFIVLFIKSARFPAKKAAIALSASLALAFLFSHVSADGLAGYPLLYALSVSIAAVALNVYPKPFLELRTNFAASLTLTLGCVPLSLFIVDLAYSPQFSAAVIGGKGLTDGLLLSTLYAPLAVAAVFSAIAYVSQMFSLVEVYRVASKMRSSGQIGAVASENPTLGAEVKH